MTCLRARVLCVFTCFRAHVLGVFACFHACMLACVRAYVLSVLACLRAWRAYVLGLLPCFHAWCACVHACLLWWNVLFSYVFCVLGVFFCLIGFTFQYLNLKILTAKNLCALLSWTYFLFTFWYQLIKLFETNLREAGKSIDISYSCSCSKAISIFYNLYIHVLHYFLLDSLLLFDLLSVKLLITLTFQCYNIL